MHLTSTAIQGVYDVSSTPHSDARGSFTRLYEASTLVDAGIVFSPADVNLSRNPHRGTARGLHYQDPPFAEAKLVRAISGRIFDVVVDLRSDSDTCGRWLARELSAENARALLVPEGCAHGFLTLEAHSDVLYLMGRSHRPGYSKGYRFDDPAFRIDWPFPPVLLSEADLSWPPYRGRVVAVAPARD